MDMEKLAAVMARTVTAAVEKATAPLLSRIAELESRAPEKGEPGRDADPEMIAKAVADAVAAIPPAKDGASVTIDDVRPLVEEAVKAIPVPRDGKDGASADEVREMVAEAVKSIPAPKDGESVTIDQVLAAIEPVLEAKTNGWALNFERHAYGVLERAVERLPKPQDGKDGRDGLGFEDMTAEYDGERRVTLKWQRGDMVKTFEISLPAVIDRGVFADGAQYQKGDGVTFGGSWWIAQKDAPAGKPGLSDDWRLTVKKGRDGRDGRDGIDKTAPVKL